MSSKADVIAQMIPLYQAYLVLKEAELVRQVQQLKRTPVHQGGEPGAEEKPVAIEPTVAEAQPSTNDQAEAAPAVTTPSERFEG